MLPQSERHQVLEEFNATQAAYPHEQLIHELFEEQVERTPEAVAVVYEERVAHLCRAERAGQPAGAATCASEASGPDQLVGLCVERSLEMVVGLLGILKAGGAYVPLDPRLSGRAAGVHAERCGAASGADAGAVCASGCQATTARGRSRSTSDWSEIAGEQLRATAIARRWACEPHHLAYVIYTSGSTGKPKGVMIEHRNVTRLFCCDCSVVRSSTSGIVWTLFHSFAFDFSVWELWGALLYGGRVVVVPHADGAVAAGLLSTAVRRRRDGAEPDADARSAQLIDAQAQASRSQHALRVVIFGGEALELRTLRPRVLRNGRDAPQLREHVRADRDARCM